MRSAERKFTQVPALVLVGLILFFMLQIGFHYFLKSSSQVSYQPLNDPGEVRYYRALSLGSDKLTSYLMLLGLQLHDNQAGKHINYSYLEYPVLGDWLLTLYDLNPMSNYPAFLATRVYSQVKDPRKIRQMIDVVGIIFDKKPEQHWRRMTEACLLAKHQLKDLPLALRLAQKVAEIPTSVDLPHWARDMKLILLDELNQFESAQLLISSMLQDGSIKDPDELRFLRSRLLKIQQKLLDNKQSLPVLK